MVYFICTPQDTPSNTLTQILHGNYLYLQSLISQFADVFILSCEFTIRSNDSLQENRF